MEFKGTQGEWEITRCQISESINISSGLIEVAKVYAYDILCSNNDIEDAYANAKLISKAPELLKEVEESITDLLCIQGSIHQSMKVDNKWEGVYELIQEQIDRKKKLIKEATEI